MLKAVVFDWAGTVVDFGSRAPMGAFVETFASFDVAISIAEARKPMGLPKWHHIRALFDDPSIAARWQVAHGAAPTNSDVDTVFERFVPINARVVVDYADVIPGVVDVVAWLRGKDIKIGSTTGYTREIMARLVPAAKAQGFAPDTMVCAGDLAEGRPTPLMMYQCFLDLAVWPAQAVVKVDDTAPGIAEGLAAGCWTVGVTLSGNCVGLSAEEVAALSTAEAQVQRARAAAELEAAGAHFTIDSVADLPPVIAEIEMRLSRGQKPGD